MPIDGVGWEVLVVRSHTQQRASDGKIRTVGSYRVYRDGAEVDGLSGVTAEAKGPGDNSEADNGRRIEAGRYPLWTQAGGDYVTIGYTPSLTVGAGPKPGLELKETGERTEILIHPGKNAFLSSSGCINLCTSLPNPEEIISYEGSRRRVLALIDDLRAYAGAVFPTENGRRIPNAWAVIDGEP
jgi:hypothetical protein